MKGMVRLSDEQVEVLREIVPKERTIAIKALCTHESEFEECYKIPSRNWYGKRKTTEIRSFNRTKYRQAVVTDYTRYVDRFEYTYVEETESYHRLIALDNLLKLGGKVMVSDELVPLVEKLIEKGKE